MQVIQEEACLFNFVLFGATGDLAMRKILPALFSAHLDGKLHQDGRIICIAKQEMNQESYLDWVHTQSGLHVSECIANQNADKWQSFLRRITYIALDATSAADYALLGEQLNNQAVTVYYLATSPKLFEPICNHLAASSIALDNARVVLEKPLGHDLESSRAINDAVARVFAEDQIYRIDHYLGKESVQNLLALRFANSLFEPLWRRESI